MSDQTIFNNESAVEDDTSKPVENSSSNVQSNDLLADLLGSIKNERGEQKYSDPVKAIEALRHSQEFIPKLTEENESLRKKLSELEEAVGKMSNIEETVKQLAASQNDGGKTPQPEFDEQKLTELVNTTLTRREVEIRQKTNISQVASAMQEKFGQEAEKVFYTKAAELGMDVETINSLAASSPQAVLQLFGVVKEQSRKNDMPATTPSGINTGGFSPNTGTYVSRNDRSLSFGATTQDVMKEFDASKKMVEELHEKGMSVSDLTDPKKYFSTF